MAEKSMVWRCVGHARTISLTSSWKPISNSLSASSSTRTCKSSRPTLWVLCKWSIMRPGVATTTSGLPRSVAAWTCEESPPTTSAARTSVNCASFCIIECTCTASSRTGTKTRTYVALIRRGRCSRRSRTGRVKAAVFPDPVAALPEISRPVSANGIQAACEHVGEGPDASVCKSVCQIRGHLSVPRQRNQSGSVRKEIDLLRS